MNAMKIDLPIIRTWVAKWEKSNGVNKTASQVAAVMLSKILEGSEQRIASVERLMKEIIKEVEAIQKMEQNLISRLKCKRGMDASMEGELKEHRRRMAVILKETDEVLKEPAGERSMMVGGLLLEIQKRGSDSRTAAMTAARGEG